MKCKSKLPPELNSNWKGGIRPLSAAIRSCDKNRKLIAWTLKSGDYTCVVCRQRGGELAADHRYKFQYILQDFLKRHPGGFSSNREAVAAAEKYAPFWDKANMQVLCKKHNWNKELWERLCIRVVEHLSRGDALWVPKDNFLVVVRDGFAVFLLPLVTKERPSSQEAAFMRDAKSRGAEAYVIRSVDMLTEIGL